MAAQLYTIQIITAGTTQDVTGRIVRTKNVRFMVGDDGPFTLVIPPEDDSPEGIVRLLADFSAKIRAVRGQ
jgi:hypothetical protein